MKLTFKSTRAVIIQSRQANSKIEKYDYASVWKDIDLTIAQTIGNNIKIPVLINVLTSKWNW